MKAIARINAKNAIDESWNPDTTSDNPLINAYLDDLAASLNGFVSKDLRKLLLSETLDWLVNLTRELELDGMSPEDAATEAIKMNGRPEAIAEQYIANCFEEAIDSPLYNRWGRANVMTYSLFGIADFIYLAFLQFRVYLPSGDRLNVSYSPGQLRAIFPDPLPFPDLTPQFFFLIGYPIIAPIILGWLCGKLIPVRPHTHVYHAFVVILIATYLVGALFLPATEPLLFAVFQTVYWLPVGYAVAYLTNKRARRGNYGQRKRQS